MANMLGGVMIPPGEVGTVGIDLQTQVAAVPFPGLLRVRAAEENTTDCAIWSG